MTKEKFPTSEDVDRLLNQQYGDKSFFYLALFSFIETYLRVKFSYLTEDDDFPEVIKQQIDSVRNGGYWYDKKEMDNYYAIKRNHSLANKVRHNFIKIDEEEELTAAVSMFLKFAKDQNFYSGTNLIKLDQQLAQWRLNEKPIAYAELERIKNEIKFLREENHKLSGVSNSIRLLEQEKKKIENSLRNAENELSLERQKKNEIKDESKDLKRQIYSLNKENNNQSKYIELMSRLINYTRTRRDYETIAMRLTKAQENIINIIKPAIGNSKRSYYIKGGPGTGKTLILIHCLEKFNRQGFSNIVLLTFNSSLCKYNKYLTSLYSDDEQRELYYNQIQTFDSFINKIIYKLYPDRKIFVGSKENYNEALEPFKNIETQFAPEDLYKIAVEEIWPNLLTEEEFVKGTYLETGFIRNKIEQNVRLEKWNDIAKAIEYIELNTTKYIAEYAYYKFHYIQNIDELDRIDYALIDEYQDLSLARLSAIRKIVRSTCVLAGDKNQAVINNGLSLKRLGFVIQGSTFTLSQNFRSTIQIQSLGDEYRKSCCAIRDDENKSEAFRIGPEPELFVSDSIDEAIKQIIESVKVCLEYYEFEPENIFIVAYTNDELELIGEALKLNFPNLKYANIKDKSFDFSQTNIIRLSTVQSIKGIDSPVVLALLTDKLKETQQENKANIIYACMTRAMDVLQIFVPKQYKAESSISGLVKLMTQ